MKKIFKYLIPIVGSVSITTPFLVSCGEEPSVVQHTVIFLPGDHGSLIGTTTITVKGDETQFKDIEKPNVIAENGWAFMGWDYKNDQLITQDITVTTLYHEIINLENNKSWQTVDTKPLRIEDYLISQQLEAKEGMTYKIKCDLQKYTGSNFNFLGMCFATAITDQKPTLVGYHDPNVVDATIDGTKLVPDDEVQPSYYWVGVNNPYDDDIFSCLEFKNITITTKSVIEINFSIPVEYDSFYFMCNCGFKFLD